MGNVEHFMCSGFGFRKHETQLLGRVQVCVNGLLTATVLIKSDL